MVLKEVTILLVLMTMVALSSCYGSVSKKIPIYTRISEESEINGGDNLFKINFKIF